MNTQEFLTHLESALDADAGTIQLDQALSSIPQWDSLAVVGFMAMVDSKYGKKVAPAGITASKTVADLMNLVAAA